ncbi:hypothetical protein IW261DRAFT_1455479 [Armillaria novae-zelandiae]|uniref:Uncharacterized protein n=1 Tax=Armillaria novae-zelandiae TaxID=153914 RepID=A0AA39PLC3_9AGAR|nr:hypothetical protein IW261DRAFT_1455479 [Armillaria novae-zelandiae]
MIYVGYLTLLALSCTHIRSLGCSDKTPVMGTTTRSNSKTLAFYALEFWAILETTLGIPLYDWYCLIGRVQLQCLAGW